MNKIRTILVACCLLPMFCSCGEVAKRMDAKLAESKAAIGIVENTETDGVGESIFASGGKKSAATATADGEYTDLEIPARLKSVPEQILRRTGYTVSYNSNRRVPNWVAWCLTPKRLTGSSKRSDAKFHERCRLRLCALWLRPRTYVPGWRQQVECTGYGRVVPLH